MDPQEILIVGTAARPRQDPVTGCPPGEKAPPHGAIYLSLYEYSSPDRALVLPGKLGTASLPVLPGAFGSRTADGSIHGGIGSGGPDCGPQLIGVGRPADWIDIPFVDGNRYFVARIETVGDDFSYKWEDRAQAVLKTLRVEPKPGIPSTTAPVPPQPGPTPTSTPLGVNVVVLNASGRPGAAAETANLLRGLGFAITFTGNASASQTGTTVACRATLNAAAHDIASHLAGSRILLQLPRRLPVASGQTLPSTRPDCVVTIGS